MTAQLKLITAFACVFLTIFVIMKLTGTVTLNDIQNWLSAASEVNRLTLMTIIIIILLCDLILSVPTLATVTLSGFFLGHIIGTIVSLVGLSLIGVIGYIISYYYGERVERKILKKEKDRLDARQNFHQHGFIMILFSRALPMLPEICACMAGLTNMSFSKFFIAWTLSNLPYVLIATYAGSVSSIDNLSPAIITSIGIYLCLGLGWLVYRKLNNLHLR